jgi:hypothetical protein
MTQDEAKAVKQVEDHANKLYIPLYLCTPDKPLGLVQQYQNISIKNPVGFDFTVAAGKTTRDLLLAIIDSGKFGYDSPDSLFGFLAGCVARHEGFKMSFREIGTGESMHVQIGDSICNAHLDSIGIAPARDKTGANLYDFSKLNAHWDRDLRPALGPLKHFDIELVRGKSDITGNKQFGAIISITKKF